MEVSDMRRPHGTFHGTIEVACSGVGGGRTCCASTMGYPFWWVAKHIRRSPNHLKSSTTSLVPFHLPTLNSLTSLTYNVLPVFVANPADERWRSGRQHALTSHQAYSAFDHSQRRDPRVGVRVCRGNGKPMSILLCLSNLKFSFLGYRRHKSW
jgi:hypothetical protein